MRTKPTRWVARIATAALMCVLCAEGHAQDEKRLIAYYFFGDKSAAPSYDAKLIPYKKLTHLIHVVVQPTPASDGGIVISPGAIEPELIPKAHAAHVKVLACVQGAASVFSKLALDAGTRDKFAANMLAFASKYGYDGVDIDWEVPQGPADMHNAVALMQALRSAMPSPKYLLSMATPSVPGKWGDFDFRGLNAVVDFYNVMTYDFHGPWTDHAGHNSPLFLNHADPGRDGSLDDSINLYLNELGVPPEKINLGTAFYGYEFPVPGLHDPCKCEHTTLSRNYGADIKPLINGKGWTKHLDPVAMAPYLTHDTIPKGFITYDDAQSTRRKVDYALRVRNLGGVFVWEISGDYDGKRQELMEALHRAFIDDTRKNPR